MLQSKPTANNALHELGYKIFLDRYAQKDMTRATLAVGDTVIVVVNSATGQREIGKITALALPQVTIELLDGEIVTRDIEHVDKPLETDPAQMMDRVAAGIAQVEADESKRAEWTEKFRWLLDDFKFVPAGRILAAAGTDQLLTYYNCYVIPSPLDSRGGIIETLRQMTEIMSRGGGVGINISSLRPRHAYVMGVNGRSSGSVSWGALYSFVTGLIEQGGSRRGALMLILNDWHPDIYDFINSKRTAGRITNANISVGISDRFMEAVKSDGDWELVFPDTHHERYDEEWNGDLEAWTNKGYPVLHYKTVKAREIWDALIESAWASAEPGIFFRERYNRMSNSYYFSPIIATNPCVTGDTRIYTDKGLIPARELFEDETEIEATIDGRFGLERTTTPSTRVFMTGVKPVHRLQTREGYYVRATADHRFMTPSGWVELKDLKPGMKVHILNRQGGFGQEGSLELGRVLGYMINDGMVTYDDLSEYSLRREHDALAYMYVDYVQSLAGDKSQSVAVSMLRYKLLAEEYELLDSNQCVPEVVFRGNEGMQRGFLNGLFYKKARFYLDDNQGYISLPSGSRPFLEDIQLLLSNLGIVSRIKRGNAEYELVINGHSLVVFSEEVGFHRFPEREALKGFLERNHHIFTPYAESFIAHVESVTEDGMEEVFDLTESLTHSFVANGLVVHNCGEQGLPAFGVCNLGAINLARFYDEERHDVLWDDLDRAVRYATRFLDNVIDSTPYFFEENEKQQLGERRVGLNNMGLAELMIRLRIRYGSDEAVAFIDRLYGFIARAAYETSAELGREKGAFPMFDAEQFLQSGFMLSMPEDVRERIRQNGIRNVTLLTQAPTGCVAPETVISTSSGMQPIVEMGDPNGEQWQILSRAVHTDVGLRQTSHFYVNGYQPVKQVTTRRGFSITATHNHQIRVIDGDGNYIWRRMDQLFVGDRVVLKKNTLGDGQTIDLTPVKQASNSRSQLPTTITPAFAEMLGLYMGDGYTKDRGGIHIVVSERDPDLLEHVQALLKSIWGEHRETSVETRAGCSVVNLTGYYIRPFFEANGFAKPVGNHGEGAAGAFIPSKVLAAGRAAVAAFLRGLFEADGSISRGTVTLVSTSKQLIAQTQIALLGLGIVATVRTMPKQEGRYGDRPLYELRMLNRRETAKFVREVGFISARKQEKAANLGAMSDRGDSIGVNTLCTEFYQQSSGLRNPVRQRIIGLVSNGAVTQQAVKELTAAHPVLSDSRLAQLVAMDVYLDEIDQITDGECHTYDLSVPDNHTYIANGFVSHNTTGTMVNTSTGIEPFFSWVYYRKSRLGLHEEQVEIVKEWREANPDVTELPDYFVTAMDLTPEEHVRVQGAIQRWVDSSISKTANLPNDYTVEQTRQLYEYMYELGCKGGTVYRDGSRDEQVLILKNDEPKKTEVPAEDTKLAVTQVATPHYVYPRPDKLQGVTVIRKTPYGTAYVTMNSDEHGYPFEVFITAPGKAGSDLQADAEGLGRMISLQLRTTAPQNRMQMLKLVIDQLQGIGGSRSIGMGPNRVLSLPDAVAGALMDHYFPQERVEQMSLFAAQFDIPVESLTNGNGDGNGHTHMMNESDAPVRGYSRGAEICPSCGTVSLIRIEGCKKCTSCGYSEC